MLFPHCVARVCVFQSAESFFCCCFFFFFQAEDGIRDLVRSRGLGDVYKRQVFNSAMERVSDLLKPRLNIYIKETKDIMAGAVFLVASTAVVVGIFLFGPRVIKLFMTI